MTEEKKVPFWRNPYVLVFIGGAITLTLMRPLLRRDPKPPPVEGTLPVFSLTNERGEKTGTAELAGQVYVANFLFTSCTTVCPLTVQSLQKLQKRYLDSNVPIRIVSFSVDPNIDTPEVLRAYAEKSGADPVKWTFLTGEESEVSKVMSGFMMSLEPKKVMGNGLMDIAHSQKLVIVDGRGSLRGFYGSDDDGIDEVFHRSRHVLFEAKQQTN
jgi:protein SCO1